MRISKLLQTELIKKRALLKTLEAQTTPKLDKWGDKQANLEVEIRLLEKLIRKAEI